MVMRDERTIPADYMSSCFGVDLSNNVRSGSSSAINSCPNNPQYYLGDSLVFIYESSRSIYTVGADTCSTSSGTLIGAGDRCAQARASGNAALVVENCNDDPATRQRFPNRLSYEIGDSDLTQNQERLRIVSDEGCDVGQRRYFISLRASNPADSASNAPW